MIAQLLHSFIVHHLQLLLVFGVDLLLDVGPRVSIIRRILLRRKVLLLTLRMVPRVFMQILLLLRRVLGLAMSLGCRTCWMLLKMHDRLLFELALQHGRQLTLRRPAAVAWLFEARLLRLLVELTVLDGGLGA